VPRDDYHPGGNRGQDAARRLDSVRARHLKVEKAHVGRGFGGEFHGCEAVVATRDDFDVWFKSEKRLQRTTNQVLVVGDQ